MSTVLSVRQRLARYGLTDDLAVVDGLVEEVAQLRRALSDCLDTIDAASGECPVCGGEEPCVGEAFDPQAEDLPW